MFKGKMQSALQVSHRIKEIAKTGYRRIYGALCNDEGIEAFEIVIGIIISIVIAGALLSKNQDLLNSVWTKVSDQTNGLFG